MPLEITKRRNQEPGLSYEPFGAAVEGGAGLEHTERTPLEVVHAVLATLQLVVQAQYLRYESGPKTKRRLGASFAPFATDSGYEIPGVALTAVAS